MEAISLTLDRVEIKTPNPMQIIAVYDVILGKMSRNKKVFFGEVTILPNNVTTYKIINDWCSILVPKDPEDTSDDPQTFEKEAGAHTLQV